MSLAGIARSIVDANPYLTLATADGGGRPWASPVWFAHDGYTDFVWASRPGTRHSQNIAARPQVSIVVFDSTAAVGTGQAVYLEATAAELAGDEAARGIATFSRRSEEQGLRAWSPADVAAPAEHRLYRARVTQAFVLDERDRRVPVDLPAG